MIATIAPQASAIQRYFHPVIARLKPVGSGLSIIQTSNWWLIWVRITRGQPTG